MKIEIFLVNCNLLILESSFPYFNLSTPNLCKLKVGKRFAYETLHSPNGVPTHKMYQNVKSAVIYSYSKHVSESCENASQ